MKNYRFFCLVIVLVFVVLTGCSKLLNGKYDSTLSIGEQIKTRHYKGSAESFGKNHSRFTVGTTDPVCMCIFNSYLQLWNMQ